MNDADPIAISLTEDDRRYRIRAKLPLVPAAEIVVLVEATGIVIGSIDGVRGGAAQRKIAGTVERHCRQYCAFALPMAVDDARTHITHEGGVLVVVLHKLQPAATPLSCAPE
jgi:HSP20 family molecular chaperone IbpA